jgi:hypothetical protein
VVFNGVLSSASIVGSTTADTFVLSSNADLVSMDGNFGAGSIHGGDGADTLMFLNNGNIGNGTVRGGAGNDSFVFANSVSGIFAGDAGADVFSGAVTIGGAGVSFWGGSGADTFNFTDIVSSGAAGGTAYFWNEEGTDSIKFADGISIGSGSSGTVPADVSALFGVDTDAGLNISFGAGQRSDLFGASDGSSGFYIGSGASTLVSYGFASSQITIAWAGGATATLQGGAFDAAAGTQVFSNNGLEGGGGTANFGSATAIPTFS